MDTIKISDKGNTKFVAHRGVSKLERENTNAAFIAAGNRSYFGIETDIHKTVDGNFIVFHDNNTVRLAVDNVIVEESTYDTLRSLTLMDFDGKKSRSDLKLPSIEEYIGICKKYDKVSVLELKGTIEEELLYNLCDRIEAMEYLHNVIFISFSLDNLLYIRKKHPNQPVQFLTKEYNDELIDLLKTHNMDLDIYHKALTAENTAALKAAGIQINCWTVDDPERAAELISFGVDMITTNILE